MNITTLLFPLLKVTTVLAAVQLALTVMGRATAAMRHLVCAAALAGCLLVPLIPLIPGVAPASVAVPMPAVAQFSINVGTTQSTALPLIALMIALWCTGAAILLGRIFVGYRQLGRLLNTATDSGVVRDVPVVMADVGVPFVTGLRKPRIALPLEWPAEFREAALRHELAHVDRFDLWTELLTRIVCAIYWFHPLVWMTAARLRAEREAACDDAVLNSGFDAPSYADALLAAARVVAMVRLAGCSMVETSTLKTRTARLLDSGLRRMSTREAKVRAAVVLVVGFTAIGILMPVRAQNAASEKPAPVVPTALPTTGVPTAETQPAAERAQSFVEQFRIPRDPAPEKSPDVYTVGGEVSAPSLASHVDPVYPDDAKEDKISGTVYLELVVGADGIGRDLVVMTGLTPSLNQAAIDAIRQWRFNPGSLRGEPVAVKVKVQVNFQLK